MGDKVAGPMVGGARNTSGPSSSLPPSLIDRLRMSINNMQYSPVPTPPGRARRLMPRAGYDFLHSTGECKYTMSYPIRVLPVMV